MRHGDLLLEPGISTSEPGEHSAMNPKPAMLLIRVGQQRADLRPLACRFVLEQLTAFANVLEFLPENGWLWTVKEMWEAVGEWHQAWDSGYPPWRPVNEIQAHFAEELQRQRAKVWYHWAFHAPGRLPTYFTGADTPPRRLYIFAFGMKDAVDSTL